MYKYVICGHDCNKNYPKIVNCYNTFDECIDYLNKKSNNDNFNILDYELSYNYNSDSSFDSETSLDNHDLFPKKYRNLGLFETIFVDNIFITNRCLHGGDIFIYKINYNDDFNDLFKKIINNTELSISRKFFQK